MFKNDTQKLDLLKWFIVLAFSFLVVFVFLLFAMHNINVNSEVVVPGRNFYYDNALIGKMQV